VEVRTVTHERLLVSILLVLSIPAAGVRAEDVPAGKHDGPAAIADVRAREIPSFPLLERRIPCFRERLTSPRWEVRYCLLGELDGRDEDTKRALEFLREDENPPVAEQAQARYLIEFVNADRSRFRPDLYIFVQQPLTGEERRGIVDYVLGRGPYPFGELPHDVGRQLPRLDQAGMKDAGKNDPGLANSIVLVGMLGEESDADALAPFLESENDYVVLETAKALIRLGDREPALDALRALAAKDPREHLPYITRSLAVMREMGEKDWRDRAENALARVDAAGNIQPNWVNGLALLLLVDGCGEGGR